MITNVIKIELADTDDEDKNNEIPKKLEKLLRRVCVQHM